MKEIIPETKTHATPEMIEEITLAGRSVRLSHKDLPLESVKLDRRNQRVQFFLRGTDLNPMTEEEVDSALERVLWEVPEMKGLYNQIKVNHGLIERIIVKADGTVVEGNCRTVVYRKLAKDFPADPKWENIETRILPDDIKETEISVLLGNMHVAGKNAWTAYEQAAYLFHMHEDLKFPLDALADQLRMTKRTIMQKIDAFRLQGKFLEKYPEPKTNIYRYSYFDEFYKKLPTDEDHAPYEEDFVDLVGQERFDKGSDVRDIAQIVKEPKAYKALKEQGHKEALEVLREEDVAVGSKFFTMVDRMTVEFKKAPANDIERLRDGDANAQEKLQKLYDALVVFAGLAGIQLK